MAVTRFALSFALYFKKRFLNRYRQIRKAGQEASLASTRLSAVIEAIPIAILYVDQEEVCVYANQQFNQYYDQANPIGKTLQELIGEQSYLKTEEQRRKVRTGQMETTEIEVLQVNRPNLQMKATYAPHYNTIVPSLNSQGVVRLKLIPERIDL